MKKKKNVIDRKISNNTNPEIKTALKIILGILVFLIILYALVGIATGEIKIKDEKKETTIQYSEILAEKTFKQKDNEYYVIYYNFDDNSSSLIEAIINGLSQTNTVYKVDLNKVFNKNYITDDSVNTNPKNLSELKVKNPTLIKIKSKKVQKVITGLDSIKDFALNK